MFKIGLVSSQMESVQFSLVYSRKKLSGGIFAFFKKHQQRFLVWTFNPILQLAGFSKYSSVALPGNIHNCFLYDLF